MLQSQPVPAALPQAALTAVGAALRQRFEQCSRVLEGELAAVARTRGIEEHYLRFVVMRPSSGWPHLTVTDHHALELASKLLNTFGHGPDENAMHLPDDETLQRVDLALVILARQVRRNITAALKRQYLEVLEDAAGRLQPLVHGPDGDTVPSTTLLVMEQFEAWLAVPGGVSQRRALASLLDMAFR